jgi:hypothetical protein
MSNIERDMEFDPSQVLSQTAGKHALYSGLIILNQPIKNFESLKSAWENTSFRICADGGANALREATSKAGCDDEFVGSLPV